MTRDEATSTLRVAISIAEFNHDRRGEPLLIQLSVQTAREILAALNDTDFVPVCGDVEYSDLTEEQFAGIRGAIVDINDPSRVRRVVSKMSFDDHGGYEESDPNAWINTAAATNDVQPEIEMDDEQFATFMAICSDPHQASDKLRDLMAGPSPWDSPAIERAKEFLGRNPIPLAYRHDGPENHGRNPFELTSHLADRPGDQSVRHRGVVRARDTISGSDQSNPHRLSDVLWRPPHCHAEPTY